MDLSEILNIKEKEKSNDEDIKTLKKFMNYEKKDFYSRYLPRTYKDLFYSRPDTDISSIYMWLKNFRRSIKREIWEKDVHQSNLLLIGAPGVGKTIILNVIAKELNLDILEFNSSNVKNRALFKRQIKEYMEFNNVLEYNKNKIIIIEELETIISCDKTLMGDILEILNPKKSKIPIIIIITPEVMKKIKLLKCWTITINKPTKKEMTIFINNNTTKLTNQSDIDKLIKHVDGDYRQLSFIIDDINNTEKEINIDEIINTFSKKEIDYSLFELFEKIVMSDITIEEKIKLSQSDKTMLNYMMFENYISLNNKDDISTMAQMISIYSESDIIDEYIFRNQDYTLNEYSNFNGLVYPSFYSKIGNKETIKNVYNNYKEPVTKNKNHKKLMPYTIDEKDSSLADKLNYPMALNKHSFVAMRRKKLHSVIRKYNLSIDALSLLSMYIESYNDSIKQKVIDVLNSYNIEINDIEAIVKVANMDKSIKISSKIKKNNDIKNSTNK